MLLVVLAFGVCAFGEGRFGLRDALGQSPCEGPTDFLRGGGGVLGCGSVQQSCPTGPEGGSPQSPYKFSGTGIAYSRLLTGPQIPSNLVIDEDGTVVQDGSKDDAFTSTEGGQGETFPQEGVAASCMFSTEESTEITRNGIQIITAASPDVPGNCVDTQRCIQCTTTSGQICTIECAGNVPTDELSDVDSFDITVTFAHVFDDPNPGPPGMIRFDGFTDKWTEFLPEGEIPDFVTTEGCNGGAPGEMVLNNNDFLGIDALIPESAWIQAFGVDDTSLGGHCTVYTILKANMPLAGVLSGAALDVKRGPIRLFGTLCSQSGSQEDCSPPTL